MPTQTHTRKVISPDTNESSACVLEQVPVSLFGEAAEWFDLERRVNAIVVRPKHPLRKRCTIRPAALFHHNSGFPDLKTVMGRLHFTNGSTGEQMYQPFTRDRQLRLRELFLPVETMPEDDWPTSRQRWCNLETVAQRLLSAAEIPWAGLSPRDLEELTEYVVWPDLVEGCVLHALAQWTHQRGECVIEIGSLRGRSLSVLAMALRGVGSDCWLISIDPHGEQRHNHKHVRLALRQIDEEARLVQFTGASDRAHKLLRPGTASLIFIDGDHSYEQASADFENYRKLVAPGGCVAFHDYGFGAHNGLPELHPGVGKTIREHVFPAPDFEPLLLAHTLFVFRRVA